METEAAVAALSALAQHSRLQIFRTLMAAGPAGRAAGAIGSELGINATTLSFHLAQLTHAGLIGATRQGRSLIYHADFAAMNEVIAYLTENCCGGTPCPPLRR